MAPSTPAGIIYQALIQSNCQAFLGSDVDVDVVSQLDAAGTTWRVHVLKTEGGKRAAVLSGSAGSLQGAFEDLHRQSAQAVDRYVASNGFDAVAPPQPPEPEPSFTRRRRKGGRGEGKGASSSASAKFRPGSPVSERSCRTASSTESEASGSESESDDDDGSLKMSSASWEAPVPLPPPSRKAKGNRLLPVFEVKGPECVGPQLVERPVAYRPLSQAGPGPLVPPQMPVPMPMPPRLNTAVRPPPGPIRPPPTTFPGLPGFGKANWGMSMNNGNGNGIASNVPRPAPLLPPGQRQPGQPGSGNGPAMHKPKPMPEPRPSTAFKGNVMLTVRWDGHGEATFLDRCEFSQAAIRRQVVDLLATRHKAFRSVPSWQRTPEALGCLGIAVRRVKVDQQTYFVGGGMQDDLSLLVSVGPAPPRVVQIFVDVDDDDVVDD